MIKLSRCLTSKWDFPLSENFGGITFAKEYYEVLGGQAKCLLHRKLPNEYLYWNTNSCLSAGFTSILWPLRKTLPRTGFLGTFNDDDMLPFLPRSLCIMMDAAIVGNYTEKWSFREQVGGCADAAVFLRNKKYRRYS
jgi:hypothetical protein